VGEKKSSSPFFNVDVVLGGGVTRIFSNQINHQNKMEQTPSGASKIQIDPEKSYMYKQYGNKK